MFLTMAAAALLVDAAFTTLRVLPDARPTRADIFSSIRLDYKLALNALGLVIFGALFGLTMGRARPAATPPPITGRSGTSERPHLIT